MTIYMPGISRRTIVTELDRLRAVNAELVMALRRLVNDSMFKDHPEASQMALDAIAKAQS